MRNNTRRMKIITIVLSLVIAAAMLGSVPVFAANDELLEPAAALPRVSDELEQAFYLTVRTTDNNTTFLVPTSSALNSIDDAKPYNWVIDWGDGATETRSGTSSLGGGISHTYAASGDYTITITPNGSIEAWLAAFGFYVVYDVSDDSNDQSNKNLLIGAPSQITPQMTKTNTQIEGREPVPNNEWEYTFSYCSNLVVAPVFAGWENISSVGDNFARQMFFNCTSLTNLPADFNLPQGLTEVGDSFAYLMFYYCQSLTNLPAGFNLPQGLTEVGDNFACALFGYCTSLSNLPADFNLPQGLNVVGNSFARLMFYSCFRLTNLSAGFDLPQGLTKVGNYFASWMFYGTGSSVFQINDEFRFPAGIPADTAGAFYQAFNLSDRAPVQNRGAASIIGECPVPADQRETFDSHFVDIDYIAVNWGGGGLTMLIPGSGDLNGDGMVTMEEVVVALQASVAAVGLTPEQLAVIDMDFDGVITLTDVILMLQETV